MGDNITNKLKNKIYCGISKTHTIISTVCLCILIGLTAEKANAQQDIILANQFNGTITIPDLPYGSSYTIGKQNGGQFRMKPSNYQTGNVSWSTASCGAPTSDSITTCGAGSYEATYMKQSDNTWNDLNIYINYLVDILDMTQGSPTYGQTPDTVLIPQNGTATLSVGNGSGTNFVVNRWYKMDQTNILSSNHTISVQDTGRYRVVGADAGTYVSKDTIRVLYQPCTPTSNTRSPQICQGQSITVGSHTYTISGDYTDIIPNANNCDSTITTHLTVNQPSQQTTVNVTMCQGETYTLPNGQIVSNAGTYPRTLQNSHGCDSTIVTTVTLYPQTQPTTVNVTMCQGETYTLPNGQVVSNAGAYSYTTTNANGCDSTIVTNITLYPQTQPTTVNVTMCQGETYTLPDQQVVSGAGTYPCVVQDVNGCDRTITTIVTLYPQIQPTTVNASICPGTTYTLPNGQVVSGAGTYPCIVQDANGCDRTITTIVTMNPRSTSTVDTTICQGEGPIIVNGHPYYASGTYTDTIPNPNGCPDIHTTNLTVNQPSTSTSSETICEGDSVIVNGHTYYSNGTYVDTIPNGSCGDIHTTNLTVNPPPTVDLNLPDTVSITSPITLDPTVTNATNIQWSTGEITSTILVDTTGMYHITVSNGDDCNASDSVYINLITSAEEQSKGIKSNVKLCPNPAGESLQILDPDYEGGEIIILNINGQIVRKEIPQSNGEINISELNNGVYFIKYNDNNKAVKLIVNK